MASSYHFLFADRALGYDCPSCDVRCCRGQVSVHRDLEATFLEHYPLLTYHMNNAPTLEHVTFGQRFVRCPLMMDDGLCHAHRNLGLKGKPAACQLFPTNINFELPSHNTVIVGLNTFCSIEPNAGPDELAVVLKHDETAPMLEEQIAGGLYRPPRAPTHLEAYPADFLALESLFVERGSSFSDDFMGFLALQDVITSAYCSGEAPSLSETELSAARNRLERHAEAVSRFYEPISPDNVYEGLHQQLALLCGLFRMRVFFEAFKAPYVDVVSALPRALASFFVIVQSRYALRRETGQQKVLSITELNSLFERFSKASWLLSHLDSHVEPLEHFPEPLYGLDDAFRMFHDGLKSPDQPRKTLLEHLEVLSPDRMVRGLLILELAKCKLRFR